MTEGSVHHLVGADTRPRRIISNANGTGLDSKPRVVRSTILKLRGLPFKVTADRVAAWFQEGVTYSTPITADK